MWSVEVWGLRQAATSRVVLDGGVRDGRTGGRCSSGGVSDAWTDRYEVLDTVYGMDAWDAMLHVGLLQLHCIITSPL